MGRVLNRTLRSRTRTNPGVVTVIACPVAFQCFSYKARCQHAVVRIE